MRICSFLPSGTEIVCALGLSDRLHGVTHECFVYPEAAGKTVVVRSRMDTSGMNSEDIDRWVKETSARGEPLYEIDVEAVKRIAPDLILTQDLCTVCAIPVRDVRCALESLPSRPQVISLNPHSLEEVLNDIARVGEAAGAPESADKLIRHLRSRIDRIRTALNSRKHATPRTTCLDWLSPPFHSGHWMPGIIAMAGGQDNLARPDQKSREISWDDLNRAAPEKLILAPCGMSLDRAVREIHRLGLAEQLKNLPAVRNGELYVSDATQYFSTSGPNLVNVLEITAEIIHPDLFQDLAPMASYVRLIPEAAPH